MDEQVAAVGEAHRHASLFVELREPADDHVEVGLGEAAPVALDALVQELAEDLFGIRRADRFERAWDRGEAFVEAVFARARGDLPDTGPRGGRRWPAAFAIRRSAWHALDHAWEIEDRVASADAED
jgi:hypothetical protein